MHPRDPKITAALAKLQGHTPTSTEPTDPMIARIIECAADEVLDSLKLLGTVCRGMEDNADHHKIAVLCSSFSADLYDTIMGIEVKA